jgi:hypothetical protein
VDGLVTPELIVIPYKKFEVAGINVVVAELTKVNAKDKNVTISDG